MYKLLHFTVWHKEPERDLTSKQKLIYFAHPSEERFLRCTREYIEELFGTIIGNDEFIMADQIVPSSNIERYLRYFKDIKVVVVDRDPRDLYLLGKYHWHDGVIPTNVEDFCKWFVSTREDGKYRREGIMDERIKFFWFEDLIYKYDKTTKDLTAWLGLDPAWHTHAKKFFKPDISIRNTRVWEKKKYDMAEVQYIENHLKDYLYTPGF